MSLENPSTANGEKTACAHIPSANIHAGVSSARRRRRARCSAPAVSAPKVLADSVGTASVLRLPAAIGVRDRADDSREADLCGRSGEGVLRAHRRGQSEDQRGGRVLSRACAGRGRGADAMLAAGQDEGAAPRRALHRQGLFRYGRRGEHRWHARPQGYVPGKDATLVARVRAAGAILLGKTNTPEFTLGGGGSGTVNLVYGLTKNPYNLNYQPSGSSGGAGAIVAAYGSAFDLGSDYGGSIRGPAFANGIAGIKPTLGRAPRTGHIVGYGGAFDSFQETGPLARRVEDLALLMPILCGPDDWDASWRRCRSAIRRKSTSNAARCVLQNERRAGPDRRNSVARQHVRRLLLEARLQGEGRPAAEDARAQRDPAEIRGRGRARAHSQRC